MFDLKLDRFFPFLDLWQNVTHSLMPEHIFGCQHISTGNSHLRAIKSGQHEGKFALFTLKMKKFCLLMFKLISLSMDQLDIITNMFLHSGFSFTEFRVIKIES